MVSRVNTAASRRRGRSPSMLQRKLLRDFRGGAMQFLAIMLLCGLGTWCFSGLDGAWRMMDVSTETYFEENRLADFWVNASSLSQLDLARLEHVEGVAQVQARTSLELDAVGLGEGVSLEVHATDGAIAINTPLIKSGEMMQPTDARGCMLDYRFAEANGLQAGDSITLDLLGEERTFIIRALVCTPEHIVTSKDVTPNPRHYGFALISSRVVSQLPFTEALISLKEGADEKAVEEEISLLLPSALIVTQETKPSIARIRNDVVMFRGLSYLFPIMAFAVAAMIVMTTLSRMIENQRIHMGTLKALGYSDRKIRTHYLSYALWPSLIGSVIGLLWGHAFLPQVIWDMETSNFSYPYQLHPPISLLAWSAVALDVALSVFICMRTYRKAARETTASLLRPKPPRAGSRIFLERITPLWRRFSFNTKMIVRNLMRNKSRTLMSLVGMLCCNMLIICSLGLQESISYTASTYYGGTLSYELRADLDASSAGTADSYRLRMDAETLEGLMEKSVSLHSDTVTRTALLTVLEENQTLIRLGEKQSLLPMPEDGCIISAKLAKVLQVGIGDHLTVWLPGDTDPVDITVRSLCDTNFNQSVYISRGLWESFHKGEFRPTALLIDGPSELCLHQLEEMDEVSTIKRPADQYDQTMTMMESTSTAFSILSGVALGLAFVICYNMGLMNFTERTRDYATLKVLGYHQKEIRRLMLRENDLTAILGVALGIFPGILLTAVILKSVETDSMAFSALVSLSSILSASAITFVFTWLIQWFLTRKVRSIDMVEALKSVE